MYSKTRIAILGPGGVGGYYGGQLAKKYYKSGEVEIIFIARPATEKVIKEKGLKIITAKGETVVRPDVVTSNAAKVGEIDFLICAVKGYDLEAALLPYKNCITANTVILPLLNGVDAPGRIAKLYPAAEVWQGCTYIVSRLQEPGIVKESGVTTSIIFGSKKGNKEKLKQFENIMKGADINCRLSRNIEAEVWEKFVFISALASLTTYLNLPVGGILENKEHKATLLKLISELKAIAKAKKIILSADITKVTLAKMERLPYEATSSMHDDFKKGGRFEYEALTAHVAEMGDELGIDTPAFDKILERFNKSSN